MPGCRLVLAGQALHRQSLTRQHIIQTIDIDPTQLHVLGPEIFPVFRGPNIKSIDRLPGTAAYVLYLRHRLA